MCQHEHVFHDITQHNLVVLCQKCFHLTDKGLCTFGLDCVGQLTIGGHTSESGRFSLLTSRSMLFVIRRHDLQNKSSGGVIMLHLMDGLDCFLRWNNSVGVFIGLCKSRQSCRLLALNVRCEVSSFQATWSIQKNGATLAIIMTTTTTTWSSSSAYSAAPIVQVCSCLIGRSNLMHGSLVLT